MYAQAFAAILALPFVAQFVSAQSCTRNYTVQAGDICDSISAAQNVSTYQLAVVNNIDVDSQCDNLNPGENLCLGWNGDDCTSTYVVQANDDCDLITSMANINDTILYMNNPQINSDCTNIYIGEVLCTAGTVLVPPAPSGSVPASAIPATATAANDLPYCDEIDDSN